MISNEFLARLLERLQHFDKANLQNYLSLLTKERILLDKIINTVNDAIIILDNDFVIQYANNASYDLLGINKQSINQNIKKFLTKVDWQHTKKTLEEQEILKQEINISYPKQKTLTFYSFSEENELIIFIFQDITELIKQTQSLVESEKLKAVSMLAAGVAHELGNPLNGLHLHLQLLKKNFPNKDEDYNHYINICQQEVSRLDTIIKQFLGAIRSSKPELKPQNLNSLISDTVEFMKHEIKNKNIELNYSFDDNIPLVRGDETQLKQAFFNLIKNAVHAMQNGGILTIITQASEDFACISFADSGSGISADQLNKIFDAYHTKKAEGSGLGLFIVDRIIRDHGGRIEVSTKKDIGSIFSLYIPLLERKIKLIKNYHENNPNC